MKRIPTSTLTDLALGHLSPEESLKLLEEIGTSEGLSVELEFIVDIMNLFQSQKAANTPCLSDFP